MTLYDQRSPSFLDQKLQGGVPLPYPVLYLILSFPSHYVLHMNFNRWIDQVLTEIYSCSVLILEEKVVSSS